MRTTKVAVLIAALFSCAHYSLVIASPTSIITTVNGMPATSRVDLGNARMVTVIGYAADLTTRDPGSAVSLFIQNEDTGITTTVPILRRVASPEAVVAAAPTNASVDSGKLIDAGFVSVFDAYTLAPGNYQITGVSMIVQGSQSGVSVWATQKGAFSIPAARVADDLQLTGPNGENISLSLKPGVTTDTKDILQLADYAPLRNGTYTLKATARNKYGRPSQQGALTIRYVRPVVKVDISSPSVADFPGLAKTLALNSPLDNFPLTGDLPAKVLLDNNAATQKPTIQGVEVDAIVEKTILLTSMRNGRHQLTGTGAGKQATAKIWINKPDAPDVTVSVGNWDPDTGIKLSASRDAYVPSIDPIQVLASSVNPANCTAIYGTTQGANLTGSYPQPVCAVRYKALPEGVTQETPMRASLQGFLQADGDHSVDYESGVIWTNPDTNETKFYKSKDRSLTLTGMVPKEPDVSFTPVDKLALITKASEGKYLTYAGLNNPGRIVVSGKYKDMTVSFKVGTADAKIITTTTPFVRELLNTSIPAIWQNQDVVVESWYNKYPDKKFSKTLTFTAIPKDPVVVLTNTVSISTEDTLVKGNLGVYSGGVFSYAPAENGTWTVQLYEDGVRGEHTPIGASIIVTENDGAFTVNLGKQAPGQKRVVAIAVVSDAVAGVGTQQISSTKSSLYIKNGSAFAGSIQARQKSGPVPFTPSLNIVLDTISRVSDIGQVEWFESADGVDYKKVDGQNTALRPEIKQSGTYWYKARLTNRHSNLANEMPPVEIQAFGVPKVTISGDTGTFVGQPATLTASTAGMESDYTWYISQSATDRSPQIVTGTDTITITPTSASDMLVKVVASEKNAPADNPARNASTLTVLRAIQPGVQKPRIYGPSYVEAGKSYEFKAMVTPLFSPGLTSSLSVKGRWVLPDGSTQDGDTIQYPVRATDRSLRYEAWVENAEGVTAFSVFSLQTWVYVWPEWQITARVIDNRVPATLRFQIFPRNMRDLQKLGGEKPTYTWQLPPSFKLIEQTAETVVVEANEPGEFQIAGTVSDSRGNSTQISSDHIQISPAPDLVSDVSLQVGDRWNRAPTKVYARLNIISLPKNDTFDSATFKLDGAEVSSGRAASAYIDVTTPGPHEVTAVVRSTSGKAATASKTVNLGTGDIPQCQMQQYGDGRTSLSLIARCTMQQGVIAAYKWVVNGVEIPSASYMVSFAKRDLDAGVNTVTVTATTDKGQQAVTNWPQ